MVDRAGSADRHLRRLRDRIEQPEGQRDDGSVQRARDLERVSFAQSRRSPADQGDHPAVAERGQDEQHLVVQRLGGDHNLEAEHDAHEQTPSEGDRQSSPACDRRRVLDAVERRRNRPTRPLRPREHTGQREKDPEREKREENDGEAVRPEVAVDVEVRIRRVADDVGPNVEVGRNELEGEKREERRAVERDTEPNGGTTHEPLPARSAEPARRRRSASRDATASYSRAGAPRTRP